MYAPAGQEAAVHGRRVRPVARVEPRRQPRLAPAGIAAAPGVAALGARSEHVLPRRAGAARTRLRPGRLRVGRLPTIPRPSVISLLRKGKRSPTTACWWSATSRRCRGYGLSGRRPARRPLGRGAQQRRAAVRRQRPGQFRRRRGGAGVLSRPRLSCSRSPCRRWQWRRSNGGARRHRRPPNPKKKGRARRAWDDTTGQVQGGESARMCFTGRAAPLRTPPRFDGESLAAPIPPPTACRRRR